MRLLLIPLLLIVPGCHKDQPPAPTAEQADQLNDAEDMLNAMAENEEEPEAKAPGPSK